MAVRFTFDRPYDLGMLNHSRLTWELHWCLAVFDHHLAGYLLHPLRMALSWSMRWLLSQGQRGMQDQQDQCTCWC